MRLIYKDQKSRKLAHSDKYFRNESDFSEGRVKLTCPRQDRVNVDLKYRAIKDLCTPFLSGLAVVYYNVILQIDVFHMTCSVKTGQTFLDRFGQGVNYYFLKGVQELGFYRIFRDFMGFFGDFFLKSVRREVSAISPNSIILAGGMEEEDEVRGSFTFSKVVLTSEETRNYHLPWEKQQEEFSKITQKPSFVCLCCLCTCLW